MTKQPLAEVFGFPIDNHSSDANRHRANRLCPFNNRVPNCTKDKANDPLGVCSIFEDKNVVVTCPVRFRQKWLIADDAASFFFAQNTNWTSLTEVRLNDANGRSAGNIDVVLVSYNETGQITDFGALEVQAVYISGNVRKPFEEYMGLASAETIFQPTNFQLYPRPDYLSSSRKRLAPQLIYKGGILNEWKKKIAVAVDRHFFSTLPILPDVSPQEADLAWLVYDLQKDIDGNQYELVRVHTAYSSFIPALDAITRAKAGSLDQFMKNLQEKFDSKGYSPDAPTLLETPDSNGDY